mgnify:CR=1 FL=1|jgi:hypothetical protein
MSKRKTFRVRYQDITYYRIDIKARSEQHAIERAERKFHACNDPSQCGFEADYASTSADWEAEEIPS